jgi:hypothetical protein
LTWWYGATTCTTARIASDGASAMVAARCGNDLLTRRFAGTSWDAASTPYSAPSPPIGVGLAGGDGGFTALLLADESARTELTAMDFGGSWGPRRYVADQLGALPRLPEESDAVRAAGSAVAFSQADSADPSLDRLWAREGF